MINSSNAWKIMKLGPVAVLEYMNLQTKFENQILSRTGDT